MTGKTDRGQRVSDHYLVRWLERERGVDMDALRDAAWETLSEATRICVSSGHRGSVQLPSGARVLWNEGVLVTYLPPGAPIPKWFTHGKRR